MSILRPAACPAVVLLVLAQSLPAAAGPNKMFGDWSVTCSDGLDCDATISKDAAEGLFSLAISRGPGLDAPALLQVAMSGDETPTTDVTFAVEGGGTLRFKPADFDRVSSDTTLSARDATVIEALLPELKAGSSVTVSFDTPSGKASSAFSLKGLVASLAFLDEAQRRDGTTSALQAKGDASPVDPATLPKDVATIDAVPEAVQAAWRADPNACDEDVTPVEPIGFSAVVPGGTLYGLQCGNPGAYNLISTLYLAMSDGTAKPMLLSEMTPKGPTGVALAYNIDWWDRTRTVTAFGKSRGLGDCGDYQRWVLEGSEDDGSDTRFVLTESRSKPDCDGDSAGGPENWPLLWPVRQ